MLLQRENIKKPIKRPPIRESKENRFDDDVIIDFDDDIGDIEVDEDEVRDFAPFKSHAEDSFTSDDIQAILVEINNRLANIENILHSNNQKVTVTTQQTSTNPVNESLANGDIMSRLRPPQNVVPENSMLGEIQSVLAQQASMTGNDPQMAGAADVSGVCTLPNSVYDDEVPNIEGIE